ncbi:MAG: endonuclease [Gammaproteobacteria bacterium]|nr:endonuclease [Gammaproteobacteria bacterium]
MMGHKLTCWQNSVCAHHGKHYRGRKCCEQIDAKFREMESELYNLWPAVGIVNIARSDYSYGLVDTGDKFYGCDFKINKSSKEIEPTNTAKGIVARATLFMSDKYQIPLDEDKRHLYLSWDKKFPPSKWEKSWALRIARLEGYTNPYISLQ